MLVETFEVTELDHEGAPECEPECESEAIELIERLGLEGQQSLLKPSGDGETQRVPYRKMTKYEAFVYEQVCPKKTVLKKYADAPIPLRVLQVASHAKDLFDHVYVWSAEDADIKDPVLVGFNGNEYSSNERFILARWGEELESFGELAKKASQIFRGKFKREVGKIAAQCQAAMSRLDDVNGESLADERLPVAYNLT